MNTRHYQTEDLIVIPARGGSKRIPRKNVRSLAGKPIISWSIETATAFSAGLARRGRTGGADGRRCRVIVSTDDHNIADVAQGAGAEVPFWRPAELADDHTPTADVIAHAISQIRATGSILRNVCCLYPTAPFVRTTDLQLAYDEIATGEWSFVFGACALPVAVERTFRETDAGGLEMLYPEHFNTRSQDLPKTLYDAGQFYWGTADAWLSRAPIFDAKSRAIQLPSSRVQDIDTQEDWELAEQKFLQLRNGT